MRKYLPVLLLLATVHAIGLAQPPDYEVYAVSYGQIPDFRVSGLVAGADPERRMDVEMMIWVLRSPERVVLVDAGFYRPHYFERWTLENFRRPSESLKDLGIDPSQVSDIVITHMHWDHVDGADLFPNAKVWVQQAEYEYYAGRAWQQTPRRTGGVDPADIRMLLDLNLEGRLRLVDGNQEILPGIRVHIGGKHTYESQYVEVATRSGAVVIASDNVYLYENLELGVPIAATFDSESNLRAQRHMRELVGKLELLIPGHDPAVLGRFPKITPRTVRID